ncbi:hypothetical protein BU23DRAFT_627324 [Bimuria novae-zelandiae CBS 107.79]|uniref:Heterokaryon incompatibility domain-containing protein n=1 Tax=Bimuria novae-zelandiae CBS 107.79 TaxID=1447943 RepID=A0A6A5UL13_9PLEO|nr:hypothetical protein BU23DRAFT_627324 [Bimuria novae-zelandiae CBS 107.79]
MSGAEQASRELQHDRPATVEDIITRTRNLGLRYLWRQCINQEDRSTKHTQVKNIYLIYAKLYATIVAAVSDDAQYGLPGISRPRISPKEYEIANVKYHTRSSGSFLDIFPLQNLRGADVLTNCHYSPGWTFQEALLSKRRLVFTPSQVTFVSQQMFGNERHRIIIDMSQYDILNVNETAEAYRWQPMMFQSGLLMQAMRDMWHVIQEHSRRRLTFDSDILDACRGALKAKADYHIWRIPVEDDLQFLNLH